MDISYKFPSNINPITPAEVYRDNQKVAVMTRYFGTDPAQLRLKNKYVNFTVEDLENEKTYTVNQEKGGAYSRPGWKIYKDELIVADMGLKYHTIGLGVTVFSEDYNLFIKMHPMAKGGNIYLLKHEEQLEIGSTKGNLIGREINIEKEAFIQSGLEIGDFMSILHTAWCASGKI